MYVNLKVIDYNWLKAEYMKKPEEMDKTGDECWFNRFSVSFIVSLLEHKTFALAIILARFSLQTTHVL